MKVQDTVMKGLICQEHHKLQNNPICSIFASVKEMRVNMLMQFHSVDSKDGATMAKSLVNSSGTFPGQC